MRRVVFNKKGGVGKSTITCNLAATSAMDGRRTLVIDLDPQGNATQYLLGEKARELPTTLADYFKSVLYYFSLGSEKTEDFIHPTPFKGLYIMASHPELEDLEEKLESRYKMFKLKESLDALTRFDAIFMDTPPALNFFTRSALIAADSCLIPFDCDDFSRRALYTILESVVEIRQDHNPKLEVEGIVVNQFQSRARMPRRVVTELRQEGLPVLETHISSSVKIRESHEQAVPLVYLKPRHKVSQEFLALHKALKRSRRPGARKTEALAYSVMERSARV